MNFNNSISTLFLKVIIFTRKKRSLDFNLYKVSSLCCLKIDEFIRFSKINNFVYFVCAYFIADIKNMWFIKRKIRSFLFERIILNSQFTTKIPSNYYLN